MIPDVVVQERLSEALHIIVHDEQDHGPEKAEGRVITMNGMEGRLCCKMADRAFSGLIGIPHGVAEPCKSVLP